MSSTTRLIGQKFGFTTKNLKPNEIYKINVNITDTLNKAFTNHGQFSSDKNGILDISSYDLQALISSASNPTMSAFILREFENYKIEISDTTEKFAETITVDSGIGTVLHKEEWRGDIVGNLFYPTTPGPHKAILHINGSVPLLQDAR